MRRKRQARKNMHHVAMAAACDDCAHLISNPEPDPESGIRMAPIHISHVPELEAQGWITTRNGYEPPDCCCIHYHLQYWEGDHGDCCGLG